MIIVPVLFMDPDENLNRMLQGISRIMRLLKAGVLLKRMFKGGDTDVSKKIFQIAVSMITLSIISAGVIMVIEISDATDETNIRNFHDALYFIFVTLPTVGYGDITPKTDLGKIVIMGVIIFFIIIMIPSQTTELVRLLSLTSKYSRGRYVYSPDVPHIVVTG